MTLDEFIKQFDFNHGQFVFWTVSVTPIAEHVGITPQTYLMYAQEDIKIHDIRGWINSLANSKRAIDCQIDTVIASFGYDWRQPFPKVVIDFIDSYQKTYGTLDTTVKLKLLRALNIVPTKLVSELRRLRNEVEHSYSVPNVAKVESAIELALLFIRAADSILMSFLDDFVLSDSQFKKNSHSIRISYYPSDYDEFWYPYFIIKDINKTGSEPPEEFKIGIDHDYYLPLLKLSIAVHSRYDVEASIRELFHRMKYSIDEDELSYKGYIISSMTQAVDGNSIDPNDPRLIAG